jgi:hypothetical protein
MGILDRDYTKRDENGNSIVMSTQSKKPMNNYIGSNHPVLTQEEFDRMRGKKRNIFSYITSKFYRLLKLNK